MKQKRIERQALIVGIVVNVVMMIAGFVVFFMTGLNAMFLDAAFTGISVISGGVAALLSAATVRTTQRFPNGLFALEPMYAICKAILTLSLLLYSFIDVLREAIDYFFFGARNPLEFGPVVIYQIAAVLACLALVWYYRTANHRISNVSTMLKAEANGTWIDGMISAGIGVIAVIVLLLPQNSPLDFLRYTGDFFITTFIVIFTIKEPCIVLRDAFVELVGGVHDDVDTEQFVKRYVDEFVPAGLNCERIHIFKTGMNFDVQVFLSADDTDAAVSVGQLVDAREHMEDAIKERLHLVNVDFVFE